MEFATVDPRPGDELDQVGTILLAELVMPLGQEGTEALQGRAGAFDEGGQGTAARAEVSQELGDGLQVGGHGGGRDQPAVGIHGLEEGAGLMEEDLRAHGEVGSGGGGCGGRPGPWKGAVW